jgi:hypothetical protein
MVGQNAAGISSGSDASFITSACATPARTVAGVSPVPVPASNSNTLITITGSNFQNGDTLTFTDTNGTPYQSVPTKLSFVSSSQITYQFNNNSDAGTWHVTVNSADNTLHSNSFPFTVR